jgi:hypothetical protein
MRGPPVCLRELAAEEDLSGLAPGGSFGRSGYRW